jgi:hypothetical protein
MCWLELDENCNLVSKIDSEAYIKYVITVLDYPKNRHRLTSYSENYDIEAMVEIDLDCEITPQNAKETLHRLLKLKLFI